MPETHDLRDELARDAQRRDFLMEKFIVPCMIMTNVGKIKGELHRRGGFRIIDELNLESTFLAVTNATIHAGQGTKVVKADFLILRGDQIICVIPDEDLP